MGFNGNSRAHYETMRTQLSNMFPDLNAGAESLGSSTTLLYWNKNGIRFQYPIGRDFLIEALNQGGNFNNPIEFLKHHGIDIEQEMLDALRHYNS